MIGFCGIISISRKVLAEVGGTTIGDSYVTFDSGNSIGRVLSSFTYA